MNPQLFDKETLKDTFLELLKSDAEFGKQIIQLLFTSKDTRIVTWENTTYIIPLENNGQFYFEMQPKDRQTHHLELRKKYHKKKGISLSTIQQLQTEFEDAPSADEIIKQLNK